jgi:hypothetical protein
MTVVPFICPKDLRLQKAMDELTLCAILQAKEWEDIRVSTPISAEARQLNFVAAITLLRVTADKLETYFIAQETGHVRLAADEDIGTPDISA